MNRRTDGDGRWTEGDRLIQLINNVVCKLQRPELGREGGGRLLVGGGGEGEKNQRLSKRKLNVEGRGRGGGVT